MLRVFSITAQLENLFHFFLKVHVMILWRDQPYPV